MWHLLCSGSLYGFGALGSPSQRSTIRTHLATVAGGNVAENFSNISGCSHQHCLLETL